MGFADEMEEFDTQWTEDREAAPNYNVLPDGPHQAIITECRVEQRQSDDAWQWVIQFKNKAGQVRKWQNLDHEMGRKIAAQDAKTLGFDGKLSELEKACANGTFEHLVCNIKVKTTPGNERDFTNVYINDCLGKGDPEVFVSAGADAYVPAGAGSDDDDIPF